MKINRTASGKKTIRMSKSEWMNIGKKAGWMRTAQGTVADEIVKYLWDTIFPKMRQLFQKVVHHEIPIEEYLENIKNLKIDVENIKPFTKDEPSVSNNLKQAIDMILATMRISINNSQPIDQKSIQTMDSKVRTTL